MGRNVFMKNIVIVAHKFLQQPDDDLVVYLNNKSYENVLHILHSFPDAQDRCSKYIWYKNGKIYKEIKSYDFRAFPEVVVYLKEFFYTFKWIVTSKVTWDLYIGMDGMLTSVGIILKKTGKIKRVVFWAMDLVPKGRFKGTLGRFKNLIYKRINTYSYTGCDELWDISPRMKEARYKFLGIPTNGYRYQKLVPFGVWLNRIGHYTYNQCKKTTIVFMGHLLEKQGVQLVIEALPEITKIYPNIKFAIIGDGKYKEELVRLARKCGVESRCEFLGRIQKHEELEHIIAQCAIAVAPYMKSLDTWTYYADPGKVKVYLACGVPVVLTNLPWNAKNIEKQRCGIIVEPTIKSVREAIITLLDPKTNESYRKAATTFANDYNYETMFSYL